MDMGPEGKIDVFLSHAGVDKNWVKDLGEKIESEDFEGRKLKVFLDEWDIRPSENIPLKISTALDNSRHMIIVLSPEMVMAPWPNAEWTSFYMNDPGSRRGTMIPIMYRTCEIPALLRPISRFDFRDVREFKQVYKKLITVLKNEPLPRGSNSSQTRQIVETIHALDAKEPDKVEEKLTSNIYPVLSLPKFIWSSDTTYTSYKPAIEKVSGMGSIPTFMLKENKLFTFSDLSRPDNPLRQIISLEKIEKFHNTVWREDETRSNWFMELLGKCLFLQLRNKGLSYDRKHRRHFFPSYKRGTGELLIEWTPTKRNTKRLLVISVKNPTTENVAYWKHHAAKIQFINLNGLPYLQILPGYTFTTDGHNPVDPKRAGKLSSRWMHDEYNSRFIYNLAFWVYFLKTIKFETNVDEEGINHILSTAQNERIVLKTGGPNINISITPMTSDMHVGIDSDNHPLESLLDNTNDELPSLEESEEKTILSTLDMEEEEEETDLE